MSTNSKGRSYDMYQDLSVAIFNHIRSSNVDFKPALMMPWLDSPNGPKSAPDLRKLLVIDMALREMIKENIIYDTSKNGMGSSRGKRMLQVSPTLPLPELHRLERYTQNKNRAQRYQWIKKVFNTRAATPAMEQTLDELETYLKAQEITIRQAAAPNIAPGSKPSIPSPTPELQGTTPKDRDTKSTDEALQHLAATSGSKRRRSSSSSSGDISMMNDPLDPSSPATVPIQSADREEMPRQASVDNSVNSAQSAPKDSVLWPRTLLNVSSELPTGKSSQRMSPVLNDSAKATMGTSVLPQLEIPRSNTPVLSASIPKPVLTLSQSLADRITRPGHPLPQIQGRMVSSSLPISASIAQAEPSTGVNSNSLSPPQSERTEKSFGKTTQFEPAFTQTPVPHFLSDGLARLREKFPDDLFEPSWDPASNQWLIQCKDCMERLYRPTYESRSTGNFEIHIKNRQHTSRVTARLDRLGKTATMTGEVRARIEKNIPGRSNTSPLQTPPRPPRAPRNFHLEKELEMMTSDAPLTFPTERQLDMMSKGDKSSSSLPSRGTVQRASLDRAQNEDNDSDYIPAHSLVVKLGPLKQRDGDSHLLSKTASEGEESHRSKRRRLSQGDDLLEQTIKHQDRLFSRVKELEDGAQSHARQYQVRNRNVDEAIHANDKFFTEYTKINRERIDDLERTFRNFNSKEAAFTKRISAVESSIQRSSPEYFKTRLDSIGATVMGTTDAIRKHSQELENLRKMSTNRSIPGPQQNPDVIERLLSKQAQMEQTTAQLQTLCTTLSERLDAESKTTLQLRTDLSAETEANLQMKTDLSDVRHLALRQYEARQDAINEKEATEKRFVQMEEMIRAQKEVIAKLQAKISSLRE